MKVALFSCMYEFPKIEDLPKPSSNFDDPPPF